MYECPICLEVNHAFRLHCSLCGTTPARYSFIGVPANPELTPAVVARGCSRAIQHHSQKLYLRTVAADYYAEA